MAAIVESAARLGVRVELHKISQRVRSFELILSQPMLWKSIRCNPVFFRAFSFIVESLKCWKKLCIGLIISGLLGSKDQNISLDPTIFVDDERFLKNYNLKIYFASLLKYIARWLGWSLAPVSAGFVYQSEPTYYIVTRCLFSLERLCKNIYSF